jgi:hypothetical protein
MPNVDKLYHWLADEPAPTADRMLGAALAHAQPPWSDRIIALLLKRANPAAWTGLVSYYSRLPDEARQQVRRNSDMFVAAIATALKSGSAQERGGGLDAYADCPVWRISHLLPPILRDPSAPLRPRAAQLLRSVAQRVLTAWQEGRNITDPARARPLRDSVRRFSETLGDAMRGIDVHLRVEVLEPCLWFCEQLGDQLWEALEKPRSRVAHVLAEHMIDWSGPNLAGFLLRAGTRPEIRRQAHDVLARWSSADRIAGLLRETHLLEDAAIRRGVLGVRNPAWFSELRPDLSDLPQPLRCLAPVWLCAGGFTERDRAQVFLHWMRTSELALAESVLRALASLNHPETRRMLESAAVGTSSLAELARELMLRDKPPTVAELAKAAMASAGAPGNDGARSPANEPVGDASQALDDAACRPGPARTHAAVHGAPPRVADQDQQVGPAATPSDPRGELRDLFGEIIHSEHLSDVEAAAFVRRLRSKLRAAYGEGADGTASMAEVLS